MTKTQQSPASNWLLNYLTPLVGATILKVEVRRHDSCGRPELWPVLHVKTKKGERLSLELSQDEEGNGPGFLFGLPFPEPQKDKKCDER